MQDTLPHRLTIAGLHEIAGLTDESVTHTISLIDPDLAAPESWKTLGHRWHRVFRLHDVIAEEDGFTAPTRGDIEALLEAGRELRDEPVEHLLVHCHMGVSRSTAAAAIILSQEYPGREEDIFAHIAAIRRPCWPNSRMLAIADDIAGRGPVLSQAVQPLYRDMVESFPDLAEQMRRSRRAAEVPEI